MQYATKMMRNKLAEDDSGSCVVKSSLNSTIVETLNAQIIGDRM